MGSVNDSFDCVCGQQSDDPVELTSDVPRSTLEFVNDR